MSDQPRNRDQARAESPAFLSRLGRAAVAFRGYNQSNLGRSQALLRDSRYATLVRKRLEQAGAVASDLLRRSVNLVEAVETETEPGLEKYDEAIALIVAMELAHTDILEVVHDADVRGAALLLGYSLGEITALVVAGSLSLEDALKPPLLLAADAIELARDTRLGVFFSRGQSLDLGAVRRLCLRINQAGAGVIGVSAHLSPNTVLLMGQGDTLERFKQMAPDAFAQRTQLRINRDRWPPLHTPLVWDCGIPNRAGVLMHTMSSGMTAPQPPVLSLTTGKLSYTRDNIRETLQRWTDSPQEVWNGVTEILQREIETVIHVGPEPNILPATFKRLHDNVESQLHGSLRARALSHIVNRPWLKSLLPTRTMLLRAPRVRQVILEDWLLGDDASGS